MRILSWNIQAGLGSDNISSLQRIAAVIRSNHFPDGSHADIICLQEVTRGFPDLTRGVEVDQVDELAGLFPEYHSVFRPAVDILPIGDARLPRWQFGCMILSRYPIGQVFNHLLTQRGISGKGMQRHALEVLIEAPTRRLRVCTTHLEFNSQECRMNQVGQLKALQHEGRRPQNAPSLPNAGKTPYAAPPRPADFLLCGDLNVLVDSPEYAELVNDTAEGPGLTDAWRYLYPHQAHGSTCGWDDPDQWPQGPHCRDFFFVSATLARHLTWMRVDEDTRASDHQPVLLWLES